MVAEHFAPRISALRQRLVAIGLCCGSAGLVLFGFNHWEPVTTLVACMAAAALFHVARWQWRQAGSRNYGVRVEHRMTHDAVRLAGRYGLAAEPNRILRGAGDIDLSLSRNGQCVAVEIKSFHHWRAHEDRCVRAKAQACRNANRIGAAACVWLPVAKPRFWRSNSFRDGDTLVVIGKTRTLLRAVNKELPR